MRGNHINFLFTICNMGQSCSKGDDCKDIKSKNMISKNVNSAFLNQDNIILKIDEKNRRRSRKIKIEKKKRQRMSKKNKRVKK